MKKQTPLEKTWHDGRGGAGLVNLKHQRHRHSNAPSETDYEKTPPPRQISVTLRREVGWGRGGC